MSPAIIIPPLLRIHSLASDFASAGSSVKCKYQTDCGAHPAALRMGAGILFPLVRRSERGANHSRLSSADVKGEWSYTSAAPYALLAHAGVVLCFTVCSYGLLCWSVTAVYTVWQQLEHCSCRGPYGRYRALCVDTGAALWSA